MERFLERVSISKYQKQFILKGGMLVASFIGVDLRSTMDIDTTVKSLALNETEVSKIIQEILEIFIEDSVTFEIISCKEIMSDFEYPGLRLMIEARLNDLRQKFKIDISTDDVITPAAIEYDYKLIFENRTIRVMTYNLETLLAEKLQTVLKRDLANTRMRDFYDIHYLYKDKQSEAQSKNMQDAFTATCQKRGCCFSREEAFAIANRVADDLAMKNRWEAFQKDNYFVGELNWNQVGLSLDKVLHVIYGG